MQEIGGYGEKVMYNRDKKHFCFYHYCLGVIVL